MNVKDHFLSLTRELEALKGRVRNFRHTKHWQTDGEWKESVLRNTLKRYLPSNIEAGRGFVVTASGSSKQLDVLVYETSSPVLFRDGDLVFVTADAVRGIIEVKSRIETKDKLRSALKGLASNAEFIHRANPTASDLFVGLFSYEAGNIARDAPGVLGELQAAAKGKRERIVNYMCLGCSLFGMFWQNPPDGSDQPYDRWHTYSVDDVAVGYFISNLIEATASESVLRNKDLWFPREGKEVQKLGEVEFKAHNTTLHRTPAAHSRGRRR